MKSLTHQQINALADMSERDRDNWIKENKHTIDFANTYRRIIEMKTRLIGNSARFTALVLVSSALQGWDDSF